MQKPHHETFNFDSFTLELTRGCLLRDGVEVKLRPKSFEALKYLVENSGRLVSKAELMQAVWPDTAVTDDSLVQCLIEIRRALSDDSHHYIKTVPRRGYIFEVEVTKHDLQTDKGMDYTEEVEAAHVAIQEEVEERLDLEPIFGSGEAVVPSVKTLTFTGRRRSSRAIVLILVCAVIALGASALLFSRLRSTPSAGQPVPIRSVAVLPFKNLSGDAAEEYFSDGMTESLITALSKIEGLKVISRGSVSRFKNREVDPREVGQQLGVAAVLEGSVRKDGDSVRVAVRLVSTDDGRVLWANESYDRKMADIFALQDEVARRVAAGLRIVPDGEGKQGLAEAYTDSVEAYQLYLKGRYFWNKRTAEGIKKGIGYFEQAIAEDHTYALAYVGLADSYITLGDYSYLSPKEAFPKAREAAAKALEIDDSLAEAHTSLAFTKAAYDWEWSAAEREFKRAIQIKPSYATARQWYAEHLVAMGRFDEALAEIKRAQELEPLSLIVDTIVGWVHYFKREPDRAIEQCLRTLDLDQNFYPAHLFLGQAYAQKKMYREAVAEYQRALSLSEGSAEAVAFLGHAYAMSGQREQARKALEELKALAKKRYVSPDLIAVIHAGLGESDQAFAWLEKAYEERSRSLPFLRMDPMFDNLRSDRRFQDLVRRIGLAP